MKPVKLISFIVALSLVFAAFIGGPGCANIVPAEGGARDSLPPVLLRSDPRDSLLHFSGNRITFSFDEYVDLDNYQQNMIVSPIPQNTPTVTRKLKTITIKLRDSLEANTTYSFDFGKTIKDVNEGNVLRGFNYVFSTGAYLDSLEFAGKVMMAETGQSDSTLSVMLHRSDKDSAVLKEKPRYVAKTDQDGNFVFHHLPPGTFYVYALKDESGVYRYMSTDQAFAFADSAVHVSAHTPPVTLHAYVVPKEEKPAAASATPATGRGKSGNEKRLKFETNLRETQDLLEKFIFTFETPLKSFDSSKIHFSTDSAYQPVAGYSWEKDSTGRIVTLNYAWKENTEYHFILDKDFATDTLGQQLLKADTINFMTRKLTDYGKANIRFRNLDLSTNPVLLFVQSDKVVKSFPLTSPNFTQSLFLPGEYNLRILNDRNKNGRWDPGEFFGKHIQPELVKPLVRTVNIKAGIDVPVEIDINAVADPRADKSSPTQRAAGSRRPVDRPGR